MGSARWKWDAYPGGAWFTCDRCSQRWRRDAMLTEWTGLKVCSPCLDPKPPQMMPPEVYPEGIPFVDARPPQDNPDRLVDDTYLQAVVGGLVATDGTYPVYPDGQQTPLGGLSPQNIIVDPIPKDTPQRNLVADKVTLRTGPVFAPTADQPAAPSAPSSSPITGVTPPTPNPDPTPPPFTPPPQPTPPPPPLQIAILPSSQVISRVGAGPVSTTLGYVVSGGVPPYGYAITAAGLNVAGGTTASPTLSTTLTLGQDTTYAITATLTDSAGSTPATATGSVEFLTAVPAQPLTLVATPNSQRVTRVGSGAISTTLDYTVTGGFPPYTYSTDGGGATVTNGTTANPTISQTLTNLQDVSYTVTSMVTDSSLATAPDTSTVEFVSTVSPPAGLSLVMTPVAQTVTRQGAGIVSTGITYTASGGTPPYGFSTAGGGLGVTNGTTSSPTVSTTLSALQDTTYTVTGTLTDSAGATPATATASVEFRALPLPLGLVMTPSSQTLSRIGTGTISTGITYTASGGIPPYSFNTDGGGTTVTGGTTVNPTIAASLTEGQDTTYTITGTLNDSAGGTPATTTATVEFVATVPAPPPPPTAPDPMVMLANGMNADNIAINVLNYASSGYAPIDMQVFRQQGVTYFRIPMLLPWIVNGIPLEDGSLSTDALTGPVIAHCNAVMNLMRSFGFVVVPVLFVPKALRIATGTAGTFDAMMVNAMTVMANRWMNPANPTTYFSPTELILNIYNEPIYGPSHGFAYNLWSDPADATVGLMPQMINAVRAVAPHHTLLVDTVGLAKPEYVAFQGVSPDPNVVYSNHIYYPNFTQIGTPGFPIDPQYLYPGRGEVIGPPPAQNFLIAPPEYNLPPLPWKTGTVLTGKGQKKKYIPDQYGNPHYGSLPTAVPYLNPMIEDYWNSEITHTMLQTYIQLGKTWATTNGVRLIVGEFGVTNNAPYASRLQWATDVVAICKQLGIPRSWWAIIGHQFGCRPKGDLTGSNAVIDTNPASPTFRYDTDLLRILKFTGP